MRSIVTLVLSLVLLVGIPAAALAQTATGQITGTVTDATGAVMP